MQLAACVVNGELPVDGGALFVTSRFPGGDLGDEDVAVAGSPGRRSTGMAALVGRRALW
jgi:hypothetical protein